MYAHSGNIYFPINVYKWCQFSIFCLQIGPIGSVSGSVFFLCPFGSYHAKTSCLLRVKKHRPHIKVGKDAEEEEYYGVLVYPTLPVSFY